MYEIKRLDLQREDKGQIASYVALVPESLQCCLYDRDPDGLPQTSIIAFSAFFHDEPVGIILASFHSILKTYTIHHLFVKEEHRSKHLGRQLLLHMQEMANQTKGAILTLLYQHESPFVPALEKILNAIHWKGVRPFMIRCLYNVYQFEMPWLPFYSRYPKGFVAFPWHELSSKDTEFLLKQQDQGIIPYTVSPFLNVERIEKMNSLGLRYQGKIVGWMLTHRIDSDTIKYSSLYIDRSFHFTGIAMKLLSDSIQLHLKNKTPWAILEIPLLHVHPSWARFAKHRLIPYSDQVIHLMQAWNVT